MIRQKQDNVYLHNEIAGFAKGALGERKSVADGEIDPLRDALDKSVLKGANVGILQLVRVNERLDVLLALQDAGDVVRQLVDDRHNRVRARHAETVS